MSISDLSQLSDLSGISRIRSSSIRPSEKTDSIYNLSECHTTSSIREQPIVLAARIPLVTNITKTISSCEDALIDYARLQLVQESIGEATNGRGLSNDTAKKLKDILVVHETGKYLQLPSVDKNIQEEATLLGIADLQKAQLSHDEKRQVSDTVENTLREKMNRFITSYEMHGGVIKDIVKNNESFGKSSLEGGQGNTGDPMRWKDQTDKLCDDYYRDLLRCAELVYLWRKLKYTSMHEIHLRNAENLLLDAQVAEVQAKITTKTCAVKMFKETPWTVDAFRRLIENLDGNILQIREELRRKKALITSYEDVYTSGFEQVLNKYTELMCVIRKKEHLRDML